MSTRILFDNLHLIASRWCSVRSEISVVSDSKDWVYNDSGTIYEDRNDHNTGLHNTTKGLVIKYARGGREYEGGDMSKI